MDEEVSIGRRKALIALRTAEITRRTPLAWSKSSADHAVYIGEGTSHCPRLELAPPRASIALLPTTASLLSIPHTQHLTTPHTSPEHYFTPSAERTATPMSDVAIFYSTIRSAL